MAEGYPAVVYEEEDCSICEKPPTRPAAVPCGHVFCFDCIRERSCSVRVGQDLLSSTCPICLESFCKVFTHIDQLKIKIFKLFPLGQGPNGPCKKKKRYKKRSRRSGRRNRANAAE